MRRHEQTITQGDALHLFTHMCIFTAEFLWQSSWQRPCFFAFPSKTTVSQTRSLGVKQSSEGVQHIWFPLQSGEHGTNPGRHRPSPSTLLLSAACRAICSVCHWLQLRTQHPPGPATQPREHIGLFPSGFLWVGKAPYGF